VTIRIIEQTDADGNTKYFAYHAHVVYHDDPDDDDFNPDNNHVVEVMAELPNPVALATWRDPMPQELNMAAAGGFPRPTKVVDVICPDPDCGATSSYPSNGDPDARQLHKHYDMHIGRGKPQVPISDNDQAILQKMARSEPLAEGEAPPPTAIDRLREHVKQHVPIQPRVANDWALKDMGLEVPTLRV
jgi:hypothetical protein